MKSRDCVPHLFYFDFYLFNSFSIKRENIHNQTTPCGVDGRVFVSCYCQSLRGPWMVFGLKKIASIMTFNVAMPKLYYSDLSVQRNQVDKRVCKWDH